MTHWLPKMKVLLVHVSLNFGMHSFQFVDTKFSSFWSIFLEWLLFLFFRINVNIFWNFWQGWILLLVTVSQQVQNQPFLVRCYLRTIQPISVIFLICWKKKEWIQVTTKRICILNICFYLFSLELFD